MSGDERRRYGLDELAELGGVTRRTVRYYLQEGLLPAPLGVGRGSHYGPQHLDALLRVKSMQEAGLGLDAIQQALSGATVPSMPAVEPSRSIWRHVALAPGVELHVRSDLPVPPASALEGLIEWCRLHVGSRGE